MTKEEYPYKNTQVKTRTNIDISRILQGVKWGDEGYKDKETLVFDNPDLQHGFTQLPNPVLKDKRLTDTEFRLYAILLSYAWQTSKCFPGIKTLSLDMGCSERTVLRAIESLKKLKLIKVERRGQGKVNIYHICRLSLAYPSFQDGRKT